MINFYIAATPIGNYNDITIRVLEILKSCDFVVCEEEKEYKRLFSRLKIKEKKYIVCNEHLENEAIELTIPLLKQGETGVLISDCGTPLFEDPGFLLIREIRKNGFKIISLPGPNSLITALSICPFKINDFYYASFLPKKKDERKKRLKNILYRSETIILIEAPYRLKKIITELIQLNIKRKLFIAYNLTLENEKHIWGFPDEILKKLEKNNIEKGEFIIAIEQKKSKKLLNISKNT